VLNSGTSASDPTGVAGAMYYNSNLGKFRCYENGAWRDCIQTNLINRYMPSTTQSIATSTDTKLNYATTVVSDGGVTLSGGNTFTITKAGIWSVSVSTRLAANAGGGERYLGISSCSDTNIRYSNISQFPGAAAASLSTATTYRFAANDTVCAVVFQSSGASINNFVDFTGATNITLTWIGS
jgi:hypothetical protein